MSVPQTSSSSGSGALRAVARRVTARRGAVARVVGAYIVLSALWIVGSDLLVHSLTVPREIETVVEVSKGWLFVALSAAIIWILVSREIRYAGASESSAVITRRSLAQSQQHADLLAEAIASAGEGICITDSRGAIVFANGAFCRMFNYDSEELIGKPLSIIAPGGIEQSRVDLVIAAILGGDWRGELTSSTKDGRSLRVAVSTAAMRDDDGSIRALIGIVRDVSAQREAESMLQLRTRALEASANAVVITNADGAIEWANPAFEELTGYPLEEVRGENPRILKSGRQTEKFYADLWATLSAGRVWRGELWNRRKDGREYLEEMTITPVRLDGDGRIQHFIAVKQDVTERRDAERRLSETAGWLQAIIDASPLAIVRIDRVGRLRAWNPAAERLFGWRAEEVIGRPPPFVSTDATGEFQVLMRRTIAGETLLNLETVRQHRDGTDLRVSISTSPIRDRDGRVTELVGMIADLTEHRRLEEQLLESQKLEAIGRLAGGVAHDFNNLLQAIAGVTQVLRHPELGASELPATTEELDDLVRRGAALTRQLLLFSRNEPGQRVRIDLNGLVDDLATMLTRLLHANVELRIELHAAPVVVEADRGQLEQVVVNLVVNASDAMPSGGTILLRTGTMGNDSVWLEVRDTGTGIPPEIRSKLFEPFFTTKARGKGTGLGLSVVHGIVAGHRGRIELDTEPGRGSCFRVVLPRSTSGEMPAAPEESRTLRSGSGSGERLLIVEDDRSVRTLFHKTLTRFGYDVTAVASAGEARTLASGPPFDLLLADAMLPDGSGLDLAAELTHDWPSTRVLLMSGYAQDEFVEKAAQIPDMRFLQKPVEIAALIDAVQTTLADAE